MGGEGILIRPKLASSPPPAIKSNLLIVLLSAMAFPSEKGTRNHFVCLIIIFFQLGQYFIITLMGHTIKPLPFICGTGKRGRRRAAAAGKGGGRGRQPICKIDFSRGKGLKSLISRVYMHN